MDFESLLNFVSQQDSGDKNGKMQWVFEKSYTVPKTNMTMEKSPLEDVFPIEHWVFCNVMLVFRGVFPKKSVAVSGSPKGW